MRRPLLAAGLLLLLLLLALAVHLGEHSPGAPAAARGEGLATEPSAATAAGTGEHDAPRNGAERGPAAATVREHEGVPSALVRVHVRDQENRPLPDALVTLELAGPEGLEVLGTEASDASGTARFDSVRLAAIGGLRRPSHRLVARARLAGYADVGEDRCEVVLALPAREVVELRLELRGGPALSGRVTDRAGRGVARAVVRGYRWLDARSEANCLTVAVETDDDGAFRVPFQDGLPFFALEASHFGGGVSWTRFTAPPPTDRDADVGALTLSEELSLAGTVRLPDGSPARDVRVACALVGTDEEDGSFVVVLEQDCERELAGRDHAEARADAAGSFRIGGLRAGRYALAVGPAHDADFNDFDPFDDLDEVSETWPAGSRAVELVYPHHRLRVRVVDDKGDVMTCADVTCVEVSAGEEGELAPDGDVQRRFDWDPGELTDFAVRPGTTAAVTASLRDGDTSQVTERVVAIPESPWETELTLVLERREPTALFELVVRGPDGGRLRRGYASLVSALGLCEVEYLPLGSRPIPVVPGRYRLEVHLGTAFDDPEAGSAYARSFRYDRGLELREGPNLVEVTAPVGGRLRLATMLVGRAPHEDLPADTGWRSLEGWRVNAWVEGCGRLDFLRRAADGTWRQLDLMPGESGLSEDVLIPGRHVVEIHAAGFVSLTRTVDILPGRTSALEVLLEPD